LIASLIGGELGNVLQDGHFLAIELVEFFLALFHQFVLLGQTLPFFLQVRLLAFHLFQFLGKLCLALLYFLFVANDLVFLAVGFVLKFLLHLQQFLLGFQNLVLFDVFRLQFGLPNDQAGFLVRFKLTLFDFPLIEHAADQQAQHHRGHQAGQCYSYYFHRKKI